MENQDWVERIIAPEWIENWIKSNNLWVAFSGYLFYVVLYLQLLKLAVILFGLVFIFLAIPAGVVLMIISGVKTYRDNHP